MHRLATLAIVLTLSTAVLAADRPVGGDRLSLKDPAGKPAGRRVKFKAARDLAVDPASGDDPRVVGAVLEVIGANPGDGNTGPIALPAGLWTGLGNPQGSKGYKFKDALLAGGVKTLVLKAGNTGGTLSISGGKSAWPYMMNQQQGAINVRLTVGGDVYCAHFDAFDQNEPGKVKAKNAAAPADCALPPPPVCGDGVAEAPEECDDGGAGDGDGCSSVCVLEDASALCAGVPSVSGTGLATQLVVGGLDRPILATAAPLDPNRLFVVLQDGVVRIVK